MKNPFPYGEVVTGKDFTDRENELKNLTLDLSGPSRIFLISPRRYGKTSLIIQTLENLKKKDVLTAYIDLFRVSSIEELLEQYSKVIGESAAGKIDKTIQLLKDLLPSLKPEITIDEEGKPTLSIGLTKNKLSSAHDVFDLPERMAKKQGKRMVVAFDEFQEIANFGGEKLEKMLRSYIQNHRSVSYLFAGSKRHLLTEMVTNRSRAFYNIGKMMTLDKIPEDLFGSYLLEKFEATGFHTTQLVILEIIKRAENVPHNVQMLSHEVWELCRDRLKVELTDVALAINSIIKTRSVLYGATWDSLSLHQRQLLKALASQEGIQRVTSSDFLSRHNLGAATSVQRSVKRLIERDVLDRQDKEIIFNDVFFREWVRSK